MTKEQQVALDAMRSAWPEETVARMLRAQKPDIEVALVALMTNFDPTLLPSPIRLDGQTLEQFVVRFPVGALDPVRRLADEIVTDFEGRRSLSPTEKPQGASTPQPPGETA